MNPLISIITVTYNAERELPITLKSVLEQTYQGYEHIIIDGASQDNTLNIVNDYAEHLSSNFHKQISMLSGKEGNGQKAYPLSEKDRSIIYQIDKRKGSREDISNESLNDKRKGSGEDISNGSLEDIRNESLEDKSKGSLEENSNKSFEYNPSAIEHQKSGEFPWRLYVSEPDKGLYDAMNKGLRLARGKYVLFLNAGDSFADPGVLNHYAEAAENSEADFLYSETVVVDGNMRYLRRRHLKVPKRLRAYSFLNGMSICHQAMMVRKELAPEFDLTYRLSADYDWAIKCIKRSKTDKRINLGITGIRYLDDGLSQKQKKRSLMERFDVMSKHYGLPLAMVAHLSFIPRAVLRKFRGEGL